MRYTIAQLLERAVAGKIGARGLRRLDRADIHGSDTALMPEGSGVSPDTALSVRREGNFLRAIQRAQAAAASGHEVSAATQARLARPPADLPGGFSVDMSTGAVTPAGAPSTDRWGAAPPDGAPTNRAIDRWTGAPGAAAPAPAAGVSLTQLLEHYRKRRPDALSNEGIYNL